jgi:glycerol-3-phosphate acyltransferase PlsX
VDWREFGGAPLLGIDGLCLISHGKSNSYAIKNAIRMALRCVNRNMNGILREKIEKHGQVTDKPEGK